MNDQIDGLANYGSSLLPASARSIRDILTACGRILTTAPRLKAEPETDAAVRVSCAELSGAVLARAPRNARALVVNLLCATPNVSPEDLAAAQDAAPYEPWPLLMRLEATVSSSNTSELLVVAEADFAHALLFPWGQDRVAELYAQRPDLRNVIRRAAELIPTRDQQRFVRSLRSVIREAE